MKNTPKHMNSEDVAVLAFHHLRATRNLSNRNVDCFIEGYKACNDPLVHDFAKFLEREGNYYLKEYADRRRESCGYSGQPLTRKHTEEFVAAEQLGTLLLKAAKLIREYKILN